MNRTLVLGIGTIMLTAATGFAVMHATEARADSGHGHSVSRCDLGELKGTFSFNGLGFAPQPPAPIPPFSLDVGGAFTIADVGSVSFDGSGHSVGFTQESIGGGDLTEFDIPFEGTYELHRGPHGEGCTGTWTLADHHTSPPFDTEAPHVFKISLARASKGFHYTSVGGGPGPVALSGFATLDLAD
jgi:hypothetical protein